MWGVRYRGWLPGFWKEPLEEPLTKVGNAEGAEGLGWGGEGQRSDILLWTHWV